MIKANYICTGNLSSPEEKDAISQKEFFFCLTAKVCPERRLRQHPECLPSISVRLFSESISPTIWRITHLFSERYVVTRLLE